MREKVKFYHEYLNNIGILATNREQEASYREGVENVLQFLGDIITRKELIQLEIFADSKGKRNKDRSLSDNQKIALEFATGKK